MNVSNTVSDLVGLSLLIWLYLLFGRHGFWRARPRLEFERPSVPNAWPDVVAVVPARNEAETVRTLMGMLIAYLTPVLALIMGLAAHDLWLIGRGGLALAAMAVAFLPTPRLYDLGGGRSLTLPVAALLLAAMTVDSAVQHRRGTGGRWKGRVLAPETQARSRAEASLRLPQSPG
jgi:hypothetical protein